MPPVSQPVFNHKTNNLLILQDENLSTTNTQAIDLSQLDFNPDALRDKYRQERDKRIRKEGLDQYQKPTGDFTGHIGNLVTTPMSSPASPAKHLATRLK